jgi:RNA polymerase sigma factor (sigma-70 family)
VVVRTDGPEPAALRSERVRVLRGILAGLHPDQREALLLKYAEGLSQEETARAMDRSTAAVNSLLQRARAAVRERGHAYFLEDGGAIRPRAKGEGTR